MPKPFCQRLCGELSSVAILVFGLIAAAGPLRGETIQTLSDPASDFVQLNADIEVLQWGDSPRSQSFEIRAVVGRNKWVIDNRAFGQSHYYFDGAKIFGFEGASTASSISSDGNPSETVRVSDHLDMVSRVAWLAFASAPTLNNPGHKLYPPWDFWKEYLDPSTFVEKLTRFEDDLGLPKTLLLFSGEHQPVLDYRVSATTNVAGWLFPQSFYLLQYNPNKIEGWTLQMLVHGKVSSVTPTVDPLPTKTANRQHQGHALRFAAVPPSKIHVEGTSNVHDWSLDNAKVVGFLELDQPLFGPSATKTSPGDLNAHAEFYFPVRGFDSGYSAPMFSHKSDQAVLHHALRTSENPNIVYRLHHLIATSPPPSEPSALLLRSTGEVVIGGITNSISAPVRISRNDGGLRLSGSISLKLSDFGIMPPSAQGNDWVVKVSDSVESSFDLQLKKVETP